MNIHSGRNTAHAANTQHSASEMSATYEHKGSKINSSKYQYVMQ